MSQMTPPEIVEELNRHIIGQDDQALSRNRSAQSLAPRPVGRGNAQRSHAQKYPHDRPNRRR